MASEPTGAHAPIHAPFGRSQFFGIRLSRDPDETYAAVCRILDDHCARPDVALDHCSEWIDGHGVESVALADDSELLYVNKGDTYDATLCYVADRGFFVSCYGDEVEAAERQRKADSDEVRCCYCGEWSQRGDACGSCGRDPETGEPIPEALRHVRLDTGHTLRTWDTGRTKGAGMMARTRIGYELRDPAGEVLFRGDDFGPSPMHADDSDEALRSLLGFLTLRPGDTDADYFAAYTDRQRAFSASYECDLLAYLYSDRIEWDGCADTEGDYGTFADIDDEGRADA